MNTTSRIQRKWVVWLGAAFTVLVIGLVLLPRLRNLGSTQMAAEEGSPTLQVEETSVPTQLPTMILTAVPTATLEPTLKPTSSSPMAPCFVDQDSYGCLVARAENIVGFDAKEFPATPKGFYWVYANNRAGDIFISYDAISGVGELNLTQGIVDATPILEALPEDAIQEVMVGEYPGQYIAGFYGVVVDDSPDDDTWIDGWGKYRLRWTEDDHWYEIELIYPAAFQYTDNDQEYLINLALELVNKPDLEEGLRAEYLPTMKEVSQMAAFDLYAPKTLPEDFQFSHGSYDETLSQMTLEYRYLDNEIGVIKIEEIPLDKADLNPLPLELVAYGEDVEVGDYLGWYYSPDEFSYFLTWETEELRILIRVQLSELWHEGGFIKGELLEIAQSLVAIP